MTTNLFRRCLSFLLAFVMVVSMVPAQVFAAGEEGHDHDHEEIVIENPDLDENQEVDEDQQILNDNDESENEPEEEPLIDQVRGLIDDYIKKFGIDHEMTDMELVEQYFTFDGKMAQAAWEDYEAGYALAQGLTVEEGEILLAEEDTYLVMNFYSLLQQLYGIAPIAASGSTYTIYGDITAKASGEVNSDSFTDGVLTLVAKGKKSGCSDAQGIAKLAITNGYLYEITLHFEYTVTGGELSGVTVGDNNTATVVIGAGKSVEISLKTSGKGESATDTLTMSNIEAKGTVTFGAVENGGTYTVNDTDATEGLVRTDPCGTTAYTLVATPAENYALLGWYSGDNLVVADTTCTVTNQGNMTITPKFGKAGVVANFAAPQGEAEGSYTVNGEIAPWETTCTAGTSYTLVATVADAKIAELDYWMINDVKSYDREETITIKVEDDTTVYPVFRLLDVYTITTSVNDTEMGTVTETHEVYEYDKTSVTATTNEGAFFLYWADAEGNEISKNATYEFDPDKDMSLVAVFRWLEVYTITTQSNDASMGTFTETHQVLEFESTTVTAAANTGFYFEGWYEADGETLVTKDATYTYEPTESRTLTAKFRPLEVYTITTQVNDPIMGTVTETHTVREFDSTTVTATVNEGYFFVGWYAEDGETERSKDKSYTFTPTADTTLIAKFREAKRFNVSVTWDETLGSVAMENVTAEGIAYEGTTVKLTATPAAGASFLGWTDASGKKGKTDATISFDAQDAVYKAIFAKDGGTPVFAAGAVSSSKVSGTYLFDNWDAAMASGQKGVVLLNSAVLPAREAAYEIPSGVTLLIPYNSSNSLSTTSPEADKNVKSLFDTTAVPRTAPYAFRTLTMAGGSKIVVDGAISVNSRQYGGGTDSVAGGVNGAYGHIKMESGSLITINNGANLYCWGYITGAGSVTAKGGATVYENFQIMDWRGGSNVTNMISDDNSKTRVFPMSQYYVQNIEVPLRLEAGATEHGYTSTTVSRMLQNAEVPFIGPNGMFNITEGYIIKDYVETTDRLDIQVYGSTNMQTLAMSMGTVGSIKTNAYELPINGNISVTINSGSINITQDVILLPGAKVVINDGTNCTLGNNSFYLFDLDQWTSPTDSDPNWEDGRAGYSGPLPGHKFRPVDVAPGRTYTRTIADLADAEIVVNGTVDLSNGHIYTTVSPVKDGSGTVTGVDFSTGGANIHSDGGGKIIMNREAGYTTFNQSIPTGDGTSPKYYKLFAIGAKLKNADGTYTDTALAEGSSVKATYEYIDGVWKQVCNDNAHTYVNVTCQDPGTCSVCGIAGTEIADHTDSETDTDHVCDYGCGTVMSECDDRTGDGDHNCDVCGKENVTECADADTNHKCDECSADVNMDKHVDAAGDGNHLCDYGCGATIGTCTDATDDTDHNCDECGKEDITDHEYNNAEIYGNEVTAATCNDAAIHNEKCDVCGKETTQLTQSVGKELGHDMAPATCQAPATCTRGCGYTEGDPTDHVWTGDSGQPVNTKLTCTDAVTNKAKCANCGTVSEDEVYVVTPALGHDFENGTRADLAEMGNCKTKDLYYAKCSRCDVVSDEEQYYIEGELRHSSEEYYEKDPTCTKPQTLIIYCDDCGATIAEETMDELALGHEYGEAEFEWVLSGEGVSATATVTCGRESCLLTHEGHTLSGDATVTIKGESEGDCKTPASVTYVATITLGDKEYTSEDKVVVGALGDHDLTLTPAKSESCGENGNIAYNTCSVCGKFFDAEDGSELQKDAWVIEATGNHNDAAGDGDHTCDVCGTEKVNEHSFSDATCTAPKTCSECSATEGDELGHIDENTDHICDRDCGKSDMGTCEDKDLDHACDYGCETVYGEHVDTNKDHKCDYGCSETFGEHTDAGLDHVCDYGCKDAIGTCADSDEDQDHVCDYGCGKVYSECADKNGDGDHKCDVCGKENVTECADSTDDKDHKCDECGKDELNAHNWVDATCDEPKTCSICGATEGEKNEHVFTDAWVSDATGHWHKCENCDETNSKADHVPGPEATETEPQVCTVCGYVIKAETGHQVHTSNGVMLHDENQHWYQCVGCDEVKVNAENHNDEDKDHKCDVCSAEMNMDKHVDAAGDKDHLCDYGCGAKLSECADENKNHKCDECSAEMNMDKHVDAAGDKDHLCDYGCGAKLSECADENKNHKCDECSAEMNMDKHVDAAGDKDHLCDYGCGAKLSECADENKNHKCDECSAEMNMDKHVDAADDEDHLCDYGCGATLEECFDAEDDDDHDCDICGKESITEHSWTDATCNNPKTCSSCGATEGEKLGHTYGNVTFSWAEDGLTASASITCGVCAEDAEGHVLTENAVVTKIGSTAGDCQTKRTTTYEAVVTINGSEYKDTKVVEGAVGSHSRVTNVIPATCEAGGYTERVCSICGNSIISNRTQALGHEMAPATCTAPSTCKNGCGLTEGEPAGHSFTTKASAKQASAASCTEKARYYALCDNCDAISDTITVEVGTMLPHTYVKKFASEEVATPATCTAAAVHYVLCDNCDYVNKDMTVAVGAPAPHSYNSLASSKLATEANCVDAATYYVRCDKCTAISDEKTVSVGNALGHSFNEKKSEKLATEATCTAEATYYVQCDNCDAIHDTKTVSFGEKLAHSYNTKASDKVTTPADCENAAVYYVQCDNCDAVSDTLTVVVGEALGHDMAPATCEAPSTCTRGCGLTEGEALGHKMSEATCSAPSTCENGCGKTEGEKLPHTPVDVEEMPALCDEPGHKEGKICDVCGVTLSGMQVIPATGHMILNMPAKKPTFGNPGWEAYERCMNCNYTTMVEIPALPVPSITTYEQFIESLIELEKLTAEYIQLNPGKDPLGMMIEYIRTGVDRYNSGSWNIMAGYEDPDFAKFISQREDEINAQYDNVEDMIKVTALKDIHEFVLPNGDGVDFGHMFGTMDITYHNNFSENHADVAGWAGDLVDLLSTADRHNVYAKDENGVYPTIEEMTKEIGEKYLNHDIAGEDDQFGHSDMYGDLDGFYLMNTLKKQGYESGDLAKIMQAYFTKDLTDEYRAEYFLKNRLDGVSTRNAVRDAVYSEYVSNKVISTLEGTRDFKTADVSQMRIACCYAFADYLCRLGGDYVEVPGNDYFTVFESEFSNLAPGITQEIKKATTADNKQIVYYIATADINRADVNVYANYNENDPSKGWKMSRVLDQAMAAQNRYGDPNSAEYIENYNVITSINADGFNMSTGEPGGLLVMLGKEWHPINGSGFFGILKNGKAVIGTMAEYNAMKDQVAEGVGGFGTMLVDEGKIAVSRTDNYYSDRASRTAVGITRSGKVIFMVLDGRQEPVSCGGSMQEIAQIMLEAGCYEAINLDGGGSTTYVAKPEGENDLRVVSKPSDGFARSVSTSLMMVSTAPSSTAFDHAALESDYDYLTPNSKIHLTAKGVSATGNEAELPEGAYWVVDDTSKATITEDGELTGLALGAVNVNLMVGNTVIGSKQILVTNPDAIYFSRETLNVVFGSPTELPVKAQYQGKPIAINTADVKFSLSNDAAGTMEGFAFTAKEGSGVKVVKITAALTADNTKTASISVSMFNQGEMSFDFDKAIGGDRVMAWDRQVSNATTDDQSIYEVVKLGEPMVTTYTFALDMSQISMPEQIADLTYMLPGADAADASAWNFLLQLAERVSVLTEVKAEVRFDKNFDVDYSQMKIVCEYFVMNDPAKGIVYNEEENTLTLTLNWKDQTQAIDPETADPLVLLSGIKLTPKADAAWDAKDRLIPVHSGEISYHVFLRANALYTFASKEANQLEYGLMPFENKDVIIGGATEKGGSFKNVYVTFEDTYTLINAVKNGWVGAEGGYMYYIDGVYHTGIQEVDGFWYDFGENGICIGQQKYNGLFVKNGKTYYARFGVLVKDDWMSVGGDRYRFDKDGAGLHGTVVIDEVELKFDNGKMIGGYSGFIKKSNGKTYHYDNGAMTLGWYLEDGDWYHFDTGTGVMNTGTHVLPDAEAKSKNAYYDFASDGKLISGYFNPAGYYYWPGLITGSEHAGTGLPKIDQWVQSGSVADDWPANGATKDSWYRTNSHGHFVTGGNSSKVFKYEVDGVTHNAIVIAINGREYTFDNDHGYLLRGFFSYEKDNWFYYWLDEPVNDGWFDVDGETYYAYGDGHLAVGSHVIDGKSYMFNTKGQLIKDGIRMYVTFNNDNTVMTVSTSETKNLTGISIAIWSDASNQADMIWFEAEVNAKGEWTATVPLCLYEKTGNYQFHAYATNNSGETALLVNTTSNVAAVAKHIAGEAFEANRTTPTCTVDGGYDMVVACTRCETELSKEHHVIPAAHTPGEPVAENVKEAACVNGGSYDKVVYCSVCNAELSRVEVQIPAGTHEAGTAVKENEIAATCTTDGGYDLVEYCVSCRTELSRKHVVLKATGHQKAEPVVEKEVAATCTTDGGYDTVVYCAVCEEEISREHTVLKATGHKPGDEVVENKFDVTCLADGSYELVTYCTVCEEELSREKVEVPAVGHQYTDSKDDTCNVCGENRNEVIETTPMYRLYNPNSGEHFYTGSVEERDMLVDAGWNYEGVAWNAPVKTGEPVYRLFNPNNADHHYTMSIEERDWLVSLGWNYEGVAWNSASPSNLPQYRMYNPNAVTGSHHYTGSVEEREMLVEAGWIYEGIGWFGMLK